MPEDKIIAELMAKAVQPLQDLFPGKHDCPSRGENGYLRVDQKRIGVRDQIRICGYRKKREQYTTNMSNKGRREK